ncbi:hypothetical protein [Psychrobacillus sp. FSL H8-0510]|uniref:hypothetical protein n=1 Tax=Psychrobacillus sp. FSL H8-0510 TaxID=2921394 RepID=UPI0030F7F987
MTIDEEIIANDILREVSNLLELQTVKGIAKYGHTVEPGSLSVLQWHKHHREELLDSLVYTTILINQMEKALSVEGKQ